MSSATECHNCGAPVSAGLVACSYCKAAFPHAEGGVECPKCENANRAENATCAVCHAPLSRGCVFCGASSSLKNAECHKCGEAFAGAEERKRARDAEVQQQQTMHLIEEGIQVLGSVATGSSGGGLFGVLEALAEDATKK